MIPETLIQAIISSVSIICGFLIGWFIIAPLIKRLVERRNKP